jgi:hypothetical protein
MGPYRPPGSSPIQRRGESVDVEGLVVFYYEILEHYLEGLMMNIPDASIDDILRYYQCHTMGVYASINRLLRKLARAITYYSEQHP